MRIKQLKLAGFKSFVDLTVVPFPGQLVAVVGPNGCGKSNVIDAVRWVMGESSAKNLRGESMLDVIFNGSTTRKAVGQASVELIFDNSLGAVAGQYSSYQEISVKRLVTRDGDSAYFLNGTRCRRRDITDIFLGTGAGARGYSIIGQGTISRLVEARPEELRAFLEEAAGISKYKERRRDTLARMNQARENLVRISDVREELGKQLQRLERQARTADQYQIQKRDEHCCKARILALEWRTLEEKRAHLEQDIRHKILTCEKHQTNAAAASRNSATLRESIQEETAGVQIQQTLCYQLATEIALLEEAILQQSRDRQRLAGEQQQLESEVQALEYQLQQDRIRLLDSETKKETLSGELQRLRAACTESQKAFDDASTQQTCWQQQADEAQRSLNQAIRNMEMTRLTLGNQSQRRQEMQARLEKMEEELQQANNNSRQTKANEAPNTLLSLQQALQKEEDEWNAQQQANEKERAQLAATLSALHHVQDSQYALKAKQAALTAMLHANRVPDGQAPFADHPLIQKPRVVDVLAVDCDWQKACECVLGAQLHAIVLDSVDLFWPEMNTLPSLAGVFVTPAESRENQRPWPRLSDKIQGVIPCVIPRFHTIFAAANFAEACSWLPFISEEESIITPQCCWMAKGWLQIRDPDHAAAVSLLEHQQELNALNQSIITVEEEVSLLQIKRDQGLVAVKQNEDRLAACQSNLVAMRESVRSCAAAIREEERLLEQQQATVMRLSDECEEIKSCLEDMILPLADLEQALQGHSRSRLELQEKYGQILASKSGWELLLHASRQTLDESRQALHRQELVFERELLLVREAGNNIVRDQKRLEMLLERLEGIKTQLLKADAPESTLTDNLSDKLERHTRAEQNLNYRRERSNALTAELNALESHLKTEEKQAHAIGESIQKQQLQLQTFLVKASHVADSLQEMGEDAGEILSGMPDDVTVEQLEQSLLEVVEKIRRLGAINLAAIEEYDSECQRKEYLDGQHEDLTKALETLERAIDTMDKDTKLRLQQTFDEVNAAFQSLFPRLFGGGRARLELTCDNLLEAGILVLAQPPGKRNSTIHLLSGGEKAMTAVALVFAIFQLNPSPFCMLDEVDAPLDDVNVARFCALVREMSQFVQFLFISHNKVTMELADHLIGVTMREPGVSRVVAVDVEQALALAGS